AGSLGPAYLKHLKGPLPFLKIIVTGGVDLDETSLKSWLGADVFAIGLGSQLFSEKNIRDKNYKEIEEKIKTIILLTEKFGVN
ncbi:MAG: hypothetical protein ACRC2O_03915, partial [Chitinophagaceae bacterium]